MKTFRHHLPNTAVTCHTGIPYAIPASPRRPRIDLCTADVEGCPACRAYMARAVAYLLDYDLEQALSQTAAALISYSTLTTEQALDIRRQLVLACWEQQPDWSAYRQGTTLDDLVVVDTVSPAREAAAEAVAA